MTRITVGLPNTHYEAADAAELDALLKIAIAAQHPAVAEHAAETPGFAMHFRRAFIAVGFQFRLAAPDARKYFHSHVSAVDEFLASHFPDAEPVDSAAVFCAIVSHGDICWRAHNPKVGDLLEIGLNPSSGSPCTTPNRWRAVLDGAPLMAPVAPRALGPTLAADAVPTPRFWRKNSRGEMVELGDGSLWSG